MSVELFSPRDDSKPLEGSLASCLEVVDDIFIAL